MNSDYFFALKALAATDLSQAHIKQHSDGAQLSTRIANIDAVEVGAYSVYKPKDTAVFDQGRVTGKKHWVSNIPNSNSAVLGVQENNNFIMVLVELSDQVCVDMVNTMGMENTFSGHLTFENCPAVKLFDYNSSECFVVKQHISLGFLTNHLGLCQALFADIDQYTSSAGIKCGYEKAKINLNLSTFDLLWNLCLESIGKPESDHMWNLYNINFAHAKKTLTEICYFILEVTGSGLFEIGSVQHQRFKDALIYCSHMRNLYFQLNLKTHI
jgi:hypothetical protein